MIKNALILLCFLTAMVVSAQIPKEKGIDNSEVFPKEYVALSINSDVLLAGELLLYKAYNHNAANTKSLLSNILYVSLRNQNDSIVFKHKLMLENGTANGDFFIPATLKTGRYTLIGYTNFSRNNPQDAIAQKNIFILNTFVKTKSFCTATDTISLYSQINNEKLFSTENNAEEHIKITLNKQEIGLREKLTLNLENLKNSEGGSYVLSVRKVDPVAVSAPFSAFSKVMPAAVFYLPEVRGELISGTVLSKTDNNPIANQEVALTIPGNDFVFKMAKTNKNGRFFFSIDENYEAQKGIIQLYGATEVVKNYQLVLDTKALNLSKSKPICLKIDPQLKDWLQKRSVQMQVENAYFNVKKDSILKREAHSPFYGNLGTVYVLDDFTRFPTVRETFVEIIRLAAIRGTDEKSRFVVNSEYDPNGTGKFNDLPPLVLIDGMLIQDPRELINYDAQNIESIRVLIQPYRYGSKVFSGVISVETKKEDFIPKLTKDFVEEIALFPAMPQKIYFTPKYSASKSLKRIPDYRVQLLWEPKITFSGQPYSTSFYTSDVSGVYKISLSGYTRDGTQISEKKYFQIVEK